MVSWQAFPSLPPCAPLAFLSRLKLPFPSLSNACHAGYNKNRRVACYRRFNEIRGCSELPTIRYYPLNSVTQMKPKSTQLWKVTICQQTYGPPWLRKAKIKTGPLGCVTPLRRSVYIIPSFTSASIHSTWPRMAVQCSGVSPYLLQLFQSAPLLSSNFTQLTWPCLAA